MSLAKFLDRTNTTRKIFRKPAIVRPTTPEQCKPLFLSLAAELSPENLTCDGELSHAQVASRRKVLMAAWGELERIFGRPVTETEAWTWYERKPFGQW